MSNAMVVLISFINDCNNHIDMYKDLSRNYENNNDTLNVNRCKEYIACINDVLHEIDRYYHKYDNVSIVDYINSDSAVWHLQSYIGKCIDNVMVWGYRYVMRDSPSLKHQYKMYEMLYTTLESICKKNDFYC